MTERIPLYGEQTEAAAQLARVFEAANCRTQLELATILDVRQSSVSDAKRRGTIPPEWLIKLLYLRGINPAWLMDGIGPKFLAPSDNPADINYPYETFPPVRACDAEIVRKVLRCFPARDLTDELRRRRVAGTRGDFLQSHTEGADT